MSDVSAGPSSRPSAGSSAGSSAGPSAGPSAGTGSKKAGPERPAAVGAVLAAIWVGASGAILCAALAVIGWFGADGGTAGHAVRVGIDAWLVAHGAPIALSDGSFSLVPLGMTAILALVLARAGRWVATSCAVRGPRDAAVGCLTLAVAYGAFGGIAAAAAGAGGAGPPARSAALATSVLALLAGGFGLTRATGLLKRAVRMLPVEIRPILAGGLTGLLLLLASATLLVLGALGSNLGRAGDLLAGLRAGPVGGTLVIAACVLYLPNAAVWAAAYALGPGFALGTSTVVAPNGVVLGELPAFPLLAAVPTAKPSAWAMAVVLLPLGAGLVGGLVAGRGYVSGGLRGGRWRRLSRPELGRIEQAALRGGLAGVLAGVGYATCAALASGAAGPGRMSWVGASPLSSGLVAVLTFAIAGAVAATIDHIRVQWRSVQRRSRQPAGGE